MSRLNRQQNNGSGSGPLGRRYSPLYRSYSFSWTVWTFRTFRIGYSGLAHVTDRDPVFAWSIDVKSMVDWPGSSWMLVGTVFHA